MCHLEDPLKKVELKIKFKNYKKILLRLMGNSNFNNYFHENK